MNSQPTLSKICRSVAATLALGAVLLSFGCSTTGTTATTKNDSERAAAVAELRGVMQRLAVDPEQKTEAPTQTTTASLASTLNSSVIASNP